jgi:hypothetical protein
MDCPSTVKAVRNLSERWPGAVAKLIEDKANGSAVIQMLDCELPGIFPVNPSGGKVARAQAISPLIEAGNVYLPHPDYAPWVNDFIEECVQFPILKSRPPNAMLAATSSEFEGTHQQKATTSRSRSRVQTSPAPVQFPASLYFATRAGRIGFSRMTHRCRHAQM